MAMALGASAGIGTARAEETTSAAPGAVDDTARQEVVEARETFRAGVEFARNGKWEEALGSFERSNRLRPHVVTLYNIGFCLRALGRYTQARRTLTDALAESATTDAATLPDALSTAASVQLEEIRAKLASADITMHVASAKLLVDGMPLEPRRSDGGKTLFVAGTREPGPPEDVPMGQFVIELDPGTHVFQLIHADRSEPQIVRTFAAGAVVPVLFDPPKPPPPAKPPEPKPRWPAYTLLGVGAAGLVVGTTFGVVALEKNSRLSNTCPDRQCPETSAGALDQVRTDADVATAAFIVGVLGSVAGGILWLRSVPSSPANKTHAAHGVRFTPLIGARSLGLAGEF